MNPFNLSGKHIVVSGASSGIGQQCALSCAAMGATVSLLGRNPKRLKTTLSLLDGSGHQMYIVELTEEESIKRTVEQIVADSGRINGLLNAAGISGTLLMKSVSGKMLNEFFQNNVYSSYILTREVCKMGHFSQEGGSVVFFSSVMGSYGEKGKSLYAMTKGAIQAGAKSLACELASKRIRVNTVSPGLIITPINENLPHITDKTKREALEKMHLLGLGETVDVANSCIYLLSDASKWVTGINLFVDGGYTAK